MTFLELLGVVLLVFLVILLAGFLGYWAVLAIGKAVGRLGAP